MSAGVSLATLPIGKEKKNSVLPGFNEVSVL
jgi:hypothetical protein